MNVAEQIVAQLVDAGVHRIYGIVGDSLNPIVDAVRKTGGTFAGVKWVFFVCFSVVEVLWVSAVAVEG